MTKFLVLNFHAKHQIFNRLNTWLLGAVNKFSKNNRSIVNNQFYKATGFILAKSGIKSQLIYGHVDDVKGDIALRIIGISELKPDEDE